MINQINSDLGGLRFGVDADGNYGYIQAGADTVTPFKKMISIDIIGQGGFSGSGDWTTKNFSVGGNSNYNKIIFAIIGSNDDSFNYISSYRFTNCTIESQRNTGNIDRGQMVTTVLKDIKGAINATITAASATSSKDYSWVAYGIRLS